MSHRGTKARAEEWWRLTEYRAGKADARAGRPAITGNQHYQRGYREGRRRIGPDSPFFHRTR